MKAKSVAIDSTPRFVATGMLDPDPADPVPFSTARANGAVLIVEYLSEFGSKNA